MSVPQTPTRSMSTTTWPGPAIGASTSRTADSPGPVTTKARTSAGRDHGLTLGPEAVDAQLHDIARSQPHLGIEPHADPWRRAGVDQVTRLEHHELAEVVDDEVRVEDHRRGRPGLPSDAVDVEP